MRRELLADAGSFRRGCREGREFDREGWVDDEALRVVELDSFLHFVSSCSRGNVARCVKLVTLIYSAKFRSVPLLTALLGPQRLFLPQPYPYPVYGYKHP